MKLNINVILLLIATFSGLIPAHSSTIDTFGRLPFVDQVQISPNGKKMAYFQSSKGEYLLVVRQLNGKGKPKVMKIPERSLHELSWLSDDRIFVTMYTSKYIKTERERHMFWRAGIYNVTENEMIWPFQGSTFNFNLSAPYLLNKLPDQPHHVLLSYYFDNIVGVFKLDIRDGSWDVIESKGNVRAWNTDWNGQIRMYFEYSEQTGDYQAQHRFNNNSEFAPLWWLENGKRIPFSVTNVSFDKDNKHIYYRTQLVSDQEPAQANAKTPQNSDNKTPAIRVDKARENQLTVVWRGEINENHEVINVKRAFAMEHYDAGDFSYDSQTSLVNGVHYAKHFSTTHYFDQAIQQVQADLEATFPNAAITITSSDTLKQKWIVQVSGADYGIQYFFYDMQEAKIALLASAYPNYHPENGGKVQSIQYKAADGLSLSGYLTTPPGYKKGKPLPIIVLPHGGPEMRDTLDFEWQRQFFAANGYAVFQPNFRGSSGFGERFAQAGYGEWGRKMQTDINDGLQHLIETGIAHPKRACIVGGSYGGYAAMMGAIQSPDLYQCAVSFAGVTFLEGMFHHSVKQKYGFSYWERSIGSRFSQEELRQYSPLYAVGSSSSPMLVMHGRHDTIVPPYHAERMIKVFKNKSLRKSKVKMIDNATHWFTHQSTRETYLEEALAFIEKHID